MLSINVYRTLYEQIKPKSISIRTRILTRVTRVSILVKVVCTSYFPTIADRLRTVSWSNNSHPTGVVKQTNAIAISSKNRYRRCNLVPGFCTLAKPGKIYCVMFVLYKIKRWKFRWTCGRSIKHRRIWDPVTNAKEFEFLNHSRRKRKRYDSDLWPYTNRIVKWIKWQHRQR